MDNYKKMEFNTIDHSSEAYLGNNAPLTNILISYSTKLKDLLGDAEKKYDFKNDKNLVKEMMSICDSFGKAVANDINAESVMIMINPSRSYNASTLNMILDNNVSTNSDGELYLNLNTYENIECITLTKTGYKFKEKKNKYILIKLNHGAILDGTPREIAATVCHELGHAFENGVFGCIKNLSDSILRMDYDDMVNDLELTFDSVISRLFEHDILKVLRFIFFPVEYLRTIMVYLVNFILSPINGTGIFIKLYLLLSEKVMHRVITKKTFKVADNITETDKPENDTAYIIASNVELSEVDRKKRIDEIRKEIIEGYSEFDVEKVNKGDKPVTTFGKAILRFMSDMNFNIMTSTKNFLDLISLTDYMNNVHNKTVYHKKYEYFADIFASAYGFAKEISVTNYKFEKMADDSLDEQLLAGGWYKVPLIGSINAFNRYVAIRKYRSNDDHGTVDQRAKAVYTNLLYTLKNDPGLTPTQKKELLEDIKEMEETDRDILEKRKKYGLLIKMHDKAVLERLDGNMSDDVVEKIMKPMDEVCKKELKLLK